MTSGSVVVVGGSAGIGREIARHYADQGRDVWLTSRDPQRAEEVASGLGDTVTGVALDLTTPEDVAAALADVGPVGHLLLVAVDRDENSVRDYDLASARKLVILKTLGYTEVVHALSDRLAEGASIVVFGGLALERPYPRSTTVSTVNGAVVGMVHAMAVELAPIRVNGLHPAIVGDTAYWQDKPPAVLDNLRARTPTGRLVSTEDIVGAAAFLCENRSVNGINLYVDGGWLLV